MTAAAQLIKVFLSTNIYKFFLNKIIAIVICFACCLVDFEQVTEFTTISNLCFLVCSLFFLSSVERAQYLFLRMLTLIRVGVPSQICLVCGITYPLHFGITFYRQTIF